MLVRNKIAELLQGKRGALGIDDSDYEEMEEEAFVENKGVPVPEYIVTSPMEESEEIPLEKPEYINYGCVVEVLREKDSQELTYHIPLKSDTSRALYKIEEDLLGKGVGHRLYLSGSWYEVLFFDWDDV